MTKMKTAGIALLCVIIAASYFIFQHISISWLDDVSSSPNKITASLPSIIPPGQGKIYVCPMHHEIMQDHPGTCPICGMELVESKNHNEHEHGIHVDTATLQKLGVRLSSVSKSLISQDIHAYANVGVDENAVYKIQSKFEGSIKKSYIHSVGQKIAQGQVIYEVYSPELIMQQINYIHFLERRDQTLLSIGDARFKENEYVMNLLKDLSRERAKFLHEDVGIETVQQIEDARQPIEIVKIHAAESGVVTQINARDGSYAPPSATLYMLSNLGKVWITATLYPDQATQVQTGDEFTVASADGQTLKTRLNFLNPVSDNNKVSARAEIDNTQLHLRPGSFVDVTIHAQSHEALVVPRSSVMRTGEGNVVMLYRGDGHFLPVNVETGIENEDVIEIKDGIRPGAEVAVNGQFLLDSSASMNAAAERMQSHEQLNSGDNMKQDEQMSPAILDASSGMHDAKR